MCHPSSRGEINPKTWFWASITTCKFTLYYSAKSDYCPFWTFECKMWLFLSHLRNLFNGGKSGTWKVWYSSHVRFSEVDKRCNQGCQKDGHCLFCRHWLKSFAKKISSVKLPKKGYPFWRKVCFVKYNWWNCNWNLESFYKDEQILHIHY